MKRQSRSPDRHLIPAFARRWQLLATVAAAAAIFVTIAFRGTALWLVWKSASLEWGVRYQQWFEGQHPHHRGLLVALSFLGGLIASISPCILSLLPLNLSYIGTREISSRREALIKASGFVLGVVTVLSVFGVFSSLAGMVLIQFRGYVQVIVGAIVCLMGVSLLGVIRLPLPPVPSNFPLKSSYGVGVTFGLVSSPCSSPILFAVLAAGGATGSQIWSVLATIGFALGYTAVIFLASVFTGLVKQSRRLLTFSETIVKASSIILIAIGGYYIFDGIRWSIALHGS